MHPEDVAELVAAEVARLRERLAAAPQLRVTDVLLSGVMLDVSFAKEERARIQAHVPSRLHGPAGQNIGFVYDPGSAANLT